MRNKLWYLTKTSLKKKTGSKWFLIVNIILAIAIIAIFNIDSIISFFGGDFNDKINITVLDKTNESYSYLQNNIKQIEESALNHDDESSNYVIELSTESEEKLTEDVKNNKKILIIIEEDKDNYLKAKVVSNGTIDSLSYQVITQALTTTKTQVALEKSNIDQEELNKVSSPIAVERLILDENKKTEDENMSMIMGTVFPTVILPFFMLTLFLVQMIGAEICEEKTTRSMEIIISNVSPKTHLFSKMLSSNLFVLIQGGLLIVYAVLALLTKNLIGNIGMSSSFTSAIGDVWNTLATSGFLDKLVYVIPLTLALMILSFIAYSLVAGILASMTVTMEDFQQLQVPIILISLVGYYLAIMAGMFDGSIFIRILSYVPFLSCLVSPALLILGQISIIDVIISIVVLAVFNFVILKYGLKVYKVGILNYSNDKVWNRFFKAIKTKDV